MDTFLFIVKAVKTVISIKRTLSYNISGAFFVLWPDLRKDANDKKIPRQFSAKDLDSGDEFFAVFARPRKKGSK